MEVGDSSGLILDPQLDSYYLMYTSSCTAGGVSCAQVNADSNSIMFYWPGSGGVSIAAGGASPATTASAVMATRRVW